MNVSTYQIKHYKGQPIMPVQDFIDITGVDIRKHKLFFRPEYFTPGVDYNGLGWDLKAEFEQEYGIKYENESCETLMYMYKSGVIKALKILIADGLSVSESRRRDHRKHERAAAVYAISRKQFATASAV